MLLAPRDYLTDLILERKWSRSVVSNSLWPHGLHLPCSSVLEIFQAIVLEWIAISFSRRSSRPRDRNRVSRIVDRHFTVWATTNMLHSGYLSFHHHENCLPPLDVSNHSPNTLLVFSWRWHLRWGVLAILESYSVFLSLFQVLMLLNMCLIFFPVNPSRVNFTLRPAIWTQKFRGQRPWW